MEEIRLAGVELYCDDLERARAFYRDVLGLPLDEQDPQRYAKFGTGAAFLCLERKGVEEYPSRDKAVVFLEVDDLDARIAALGQGRIVGRGAGRRRWAALHDPDGHNVVLLERAP